MIRDTSLSSKLWIYTVWAVVGFFVLNLLAMIASVVTSSFATRWLGTWFPSGLTTRWYASAWNEFQLQDVLLVTFQVVGAVVLISGLIGVTGAYALARRDFGGKKFVMLIMILPLIIPPITFGIPLATVLYQTGLAGTFWGVVAANLVPTVPFVILVMIPFIEQIDPKIEAAARVFGASTFKLFVHVLMPLLLPGILAALLLVLVRTTAMASMDWTARTPAANTA
jgi:putative spermidine/putrescine transport system permease protein